MSEKTENMIQKNMKNEIGKDVSDKFLKLVNANKEFIEALIYIGKNIIGTVDLSKCANKLKYDLIEVVDDGILLEKKIKDSFNKIDCLSFKNLGIFAIFNTLLSLGNLEIPNSNINEIINTIMSLTKLDLRYLIKDQLKNWWTPDYVYNNH